LDHDDAMAGARQGERRRDAGERAADDGDLDSSEHRQRRPSERDRHVAAFLFGPFATARGSAGEPAAQSVRLVAVAVAATQLTWTAAVATPRGMRYFMPVMAIPRMT